MSDNEFCGGGIKGVRDLSVERVEGAVAFFHRVTLADVQNFDDVDVVRLNARVLDQSVLRDEERAHGMAKIRRRGRSSGAQKSIELKSAHPALADFVFLVLLFARCLRSAHQMIALTL